MNQQLDLIVTERARTARAIRHQAENADPFTRYRKGLWNKIRRTIKHGGTKARALLPELIGCDFECLKACWETYMELGPEGMTWAALVATKTGGPDGIHIDHVIAKKTFYHQGRAGLQAGNHWLNLRPCPGLANLKKGYKAA